VPQAVIVLTFPPVSIGTVAKATSAHVTLIDLAALELHEREMDKLSRRLDELHLSKSRHSGAACETAEAVNRQVVYFTAQIFRHRVSIALLASRLGAPWAGQS
jgi:hypothetical protein